MGRTDWSQTLKKPTELKDGVTAYTRPIKNWCGGRRWSERPRRSKIVTAKRRQWRHQRQLAQRNHLPTSWKFGTLQRGPSSTTYISYVSIFIVLLSPVKYAATVVFAVEKNLPCTLYWRTENVNKRFLHPFRRVPHSSSIFGDRFPKKGQSFCRIFVCVTASNEIVILW